MQKAIKSDIFIIFILLIIFLSVLPFFYMHQGVFSVDIGRELYISQRVYLGDVLYKDIFNVYGPFAYQFNAILMKLFSQKIYTVYNFGLINSFAIITALYFIARHFMKKSLSFLFSFMSIFSLVYPVFLFNSNITYSFGLSYALSSFLISLLFLLKFIKTENVKFAYISSFFAGISILNKYEFFLYPFVLLYVLIFLKPIGIKNIIKSFICFISVPVISFSVLFIQGLTFGELVSAIQYMVKMTGSKSVHLMYAKYGTVFIPELYFKLIARHGILSIIGFIPIINIILFTIFFKSIKQDKLLLIFCLCVFCAAFKYTLYLNIGYMGVYVFPLCLMLTMVLSDKFGDFNRLKYLILLTLIVFCAYVDFDMLKAKNNLLETSKGNFYMYDWDKMIMKTVIDYTNKNIPDNKTLVVMPEGSFANYITDRKSDSLYHNLVPLYYTDTFGEEQVLNHFKEQPADYFALIPLSTIEYGSPRFCVYAKNFCEMIENNYTLEKDENGVRIYKRK